MYIYHYTFIHIQMYSTYTHLYVYIYNWKYIYMYCLCIYIYMYMHICVFIYVPLYVYIFIAIMQSLKPSFHYCSIVPTAPHSGHFQLLCSKRASTFYYVLLKLGTTSLSLFWLLPQSHGTSQFISYSEPSR